MKFFARTTQVFAVVLAIILSVTMMVTEITLMILQSASFIMSKEVIQELIQSIDISELLGYEDDSELVIYEPETHHLDAAGNSHTFISSGEASDNDQENVIDSMIGSFMKAFENLSESEQQEMQASLEEIDIKAIVEGLSEEPVPEDASEEEVVNMLYATVTSLDTVQELVAEVSANVLDNLINDNNKDVITADTLNSLISDIAEEIREKTGVELPEKFVSMATTIIEDNSQTLVDDLDEIMDGGIQGILGGTTGTDGEGNSDLQQLTETLNAIMFVFSVKTRLILLGAVVLLGGIIFLLFFKGKGGLIWDAVVTLLSSSVILAVGLVANMSSSLTFSSGESMSGAMNGVLSSIMPVLGKQFIKTAIIGYAVAVLLIALFVVLRILKSKKAAALAVKTEDETPAEEAIEGEVTAEVDEAVGAETTPEAEETVEAGSPAEVGCEAETPVEVEGESEAPVEVQ